MKINYILFYAASLLHFRFIYFYLFTLNYLFIHLFFLLFSSSVVVLFLFFVVFVFVLFLTIKYNPV